MTKTNQPIRDAFGAGEPFDLKNGATVTVAPAPVVELERLWGIYAESLLSFRLGFLFAPGNEERLGKFKVLMLAANGQYFKDDEEEDRNKAFNSLFEKFGNVWDAEEEAARFIQRFLGVIPRTTGEQTEQPG